MKQLFGNMLALLLLATAAASGAEELRPVPHVKSAPALCGAQSLTVEAFFKMKTLAQSPRLVSKYGHLAHSHRGWELCLNDGIPAFRVNISLIEGGQQDFEIHATAPVKVNCWTHIAGVFADEGNGLRRLVLYVDGKRGAELRLPDNCSIHSNPEVDVMVGSYGEMPIAPAEMCIDELRISASPVAFLRVPDRPYKPGADTIALFHFDAPAQQPWTAPGYAAGIEGKGPSVKGVFGNALELTGPMTPEYFAAVKSKGREQRLDEKISGDFRLAIHDGKVPAKLVLNYQGKKPLSLNGTLAHENTPQNVVRRFQCVVAGDTVCEIPLDGLADGRWLCTLTEKGAAPDTKDTLVRLLRLQRARRVAAPAEPIAVSGEKLYPVDDWQIASFDGVTTVALPAEAVVEVSASSTSVQRTVGDEWLGEDGAGNLVQNFMPVNFSKSAGPMQWGIRTPEGKRSIAANPPADWKPYPAAKLAPLPDAARFRRSDLSDMNKAKVRFWREEDGVPPLAEIRVQCVAPHVGNAHKYGLENWGTYAVWEKVPGEWLILSKTPLCVCKFGFTERELEKREAANDNFGGQWLSEDGKTLFYSQGGKLRRFTPFVVEYDNIPDSYRAMRVFYSHDGFNWQERFVMMPDESDHWSSQHYGFAMRRLEKNFYVAFLSYYNVRQQQMRPEVWFSRNSLDWERPAKHGFMVGNTPKPGSWLFGMAFADSRSPILEHNGNWYVLIGNGWNRCQHFYFNYTTPDHPEAYTPQELRRVFQPKKLAAKWPFFQQAGGWEGLSKLYADFNEGRGSTVGFARMRRDGLLAARAEKDGTITTRVLTAPGNRLKLNGKGAFTVELLSAEGTPLPDFSGANAARFTGDSIDAGLRFGAAETLPGTPFRIRVGLTRGSELYTLRFER